MLTKVEWLRKDGEVSERQWRDVTGILKSQGDRLARDYMGRWATELGVADLLERARSESGQEPALPLDLPGARHDGIVPP